jgi:hypothetical protein
LLERLRKANFDLALAGHAAAILKGDFPDALEEIERMLLDVSVPIGEIIGSGGGEAKGTQRMRKALAALHWDKFNFEIKKIINGVERESVSHEIDHVKTFDAGIIALEIEWNNKDPFFDRDLENFKRLHGEGAISVGIIVTRGTTLQSRLWELVYRFAREKGLNSFEVLRAQGIVPTPKQVEAIGARVNRMKNPVPFAEAWTDKFVSDKFGQATTHWTKLMERIQRGVGNPCPLVLIGLPASVVTFEIAEQLPYPANPAK